MSDIDAYFEKQDGTVRQIALALRDHITAKGPDLTCKLAWGFPCWSGNERIFSVIAHSDRCNLQLWYGAELKQRFGKRIEGTGKALRHVKVRAVEDLDAELDQIIEAAIALDATTPQRVR